MRELVLDEVFLVSGGKGKGEKKPSGGGKPGGSKPIVDVKQQHSSLQNDEQYYDKAANGVVYTSRDACIDAASSQYKRDVAAIGAIGGSAAAAAVCVASGAGALAAGGCAVVGGIAGMALGEAIANSSADSVAEGLCPPEAGA